MKECKYEAGYIGKKDDLRYRAKQLLKGDTDRKPVGAYPSASAAQFQKLRPYKKGGVVKASSSKSMSELHIPDQIKLKKQKLDAQDNVASGFLPKKHDKLKKGGAVKVTKSKPIRAGSHPMIGTKKKSVEFASGVKPKVNKSVKAKQAQPFDASHGMYLKKGGKVKKGDK